MTLEQTLHGRRVTAMRTGTRPANDALGHTGRHFLQKAEHWEDLSTGDGTHEGAPSRFRDEAKDRNYPLALFWSWARGWQPPPAGLAVFWQPPAQAWLQGAHDEGYAARYFKLILLIGSFEKWKRLPDADEQEGYTLEGIYGDYLVRLSPRGQGPGTNYAVKSAHLNGGTVYREEPGFGLPPETIGQLQSFPVRCQQRGRGRVSVGGGQK